MQCAKFMSCILLSTVLACGSCDFIPNNNEEIEIELGEYGYTHEDICHHFEHMDMEYDCPTPKTSREGSPIRQIVDNCPTPKTSRTNSPDTTIVESILQKKGIHIKPSNHR